MYILTQDKKTILEFGHIEFGRLEVGRNIVGNRDGRIALTANSGSYSTPVLMGLYPDEATAGAELARIWLALKNGENFFEVQ